MTDNTMATPSSVDSPAESLRKRNTPIRTHSKADARRAVLELNALEEQEIKDDKDRKTFGGTPGGTDTSSPRLLSCFPIALAERPIVFTVPYTHDMVSQLLSPTEPKNL